MSRLSQRLLPTAAALAVSFAPLSAQQDTTFQVDVQLVNLLATVKDIQGTPLGDIEQDEFTVMDGGVPRPVAVFERRTDRPLSVALMIDASLSTAIELQEERLSAERFIQNLLGAGSHPADRVAVLKFSAYVDMLADFTRSLPGLSRALRAVRAESGTAMYDAILLASQELASRPGRRVMIIITDGGDTTSSTGFLEAVKSAHAADAVIYGMIVMPIKSDAGRNTGGENALKTLATSTGGATFVQSGTENLDEAFRQILRNLRTQYLLGYYPPEIPQNGETFRAIEVLVDRPGTSVLVRNGYYLPDVPRISTPPATISIRQKPQAGDSNANGAKPPAVTKKKQ